METTLSGQTLTSDPLIELFLHDHFTEDRTERPEFVLGFEALRKHELEALCDMYGVERRPDITKAELLPIVEVAWVNNKFPRPRTQTERLKDEAKQELLTDPEFLSQVAAQVAVQQAPQPQQTFTPPHITQDPIAEQPKSPAMDASSLSTMGWHEFLAFAKESGVDVGKSDGTKGVRSRDDITDDLVKAGVVVMGTAHAEDAA